MVDKLDNDRLIGCIDELVQHVKTAGKKAKNLYDFTLFLPISQKNDRNLENKWEQFFKDVKNNIDVYLEGFHNGAVDIILLEGELVAVTYYLNLPEIYPVPVSIGFMSYDKLFSKSMLN